MLFPPKGEVKFRYDKIKLYTLTFQCDFIS